MGSLILISRDRRRGQGSEGLSGGSAAAVAIPFFAFRIMVGCGLVMLGIVLLGGWLRWRGRLDDTPPFLQLCQLVIPIGFIAVIAGWVVTEVGRQPWTVYGLLRTADWVSPSLAGSTY